MPSFNPSNREPSADATVPAGVYMIALVWFTRKRSKADKDYLNCKFEVCAGPQFGNTFFTMLSLDTTNSASSFRLQLICESVGQTEAFEIGDTAEGTNGQGDENWSRILKGIPIKAEISRRTNGEYVNNNLAKIIPKKSWADKDKHAAASWVTEYGQRSGDYGDPDDQPSSADANAAKKGEPHLSILDSADPDDDVPW